MFLKKNHFLSVAAIISSIALSQNSFALRNTPEGSLKLYEAIAIKDNQFSQASTNLTNTTKIVLPVSRNFDQRMTGLCWTFAFFNALETMHLVEHPDEKIEFSRGAMQYINMQDRIEAKIQGTETHLNINGPFDWSIEGGVFLDAVDIVKKYGAYQYADYHNIISSSNYGNLLKSIFSASTADDQRSQAPGALLKHFGDALPEKTQFHEQWISPVEFGSYFVDQGQWHDYGISEDGTEYFAQNSDPDARPGTMVHYIARENVVNKMREALENQKPILYGTDVHAVLIYGAEFDEQKKPTKFYIKNSNGFPGFFYTADAERTLNNLADITVLE